LEDKIIKEYRFLLGKEIKNVRKARGYSQSELAEILQIDRSTISKIENGLFSISVDYLMKFSLALNHEFKIIDKRFLPGENK